MTFNKICKQCTQNFITHIWEQEYCSKSCRVQFNNSKRQRPLKPRERIIDKYTDLPFSRQYKHMLRKRDKGLCKTCAKPVHKSTTMCLEHLIKHRELFRRYYNLKRRWLNAKSYQQ